MRTRRETLNAVCKDHEDEKSSAGSIRVEYVSFIPLTDKISEVAIVLETNSRFISSFISLLNAKTYPSFQHFSCHTLPSVYGPIYLQVPNPGEPPPNTESARKGCHPTCM